MLRRRLLGSGDLHGRDDDYDHFDHDVNHHNVDNDLNDAGADHDVNDDNLDHNLNDAGADHDLNHHNVDDDLNDAGSDHDDDCRTRGLRIR
ncbi:MAG: hypothetical protein KF883_00190 [Thermomicrobiales bacterium]|nr:hypothetical protein [Thermomicrobiales bacterium]